MIAARVPIDPAPPGRDARDREIARGLDREDPRAVQPVDDGRVAFDGLHQLDRALAGVPEDDLELALRPGVQVETHAPEDGEAAQEPVPGQPLVRALEDLLGPHPRGRSPVVAGARADVPEIADVVVQPLELEGDPAQEAGAGRHLDVGDLLRRLGEAEAVRQRAGPTQALDRHSLNALLQPAVGVEQAGVEVKDGLAHGAEAEVTGLDDARVDGPDGDLEHALALHLEVRELLRRLHGRAGAGGEGLAQGVKPGRPAVVHHEGTGIGVAGGLDAEEVAHLALVPVGGRDDRSEGGHPGAARVHRHDQGHEEVGQGRAGRLSGLEQVTRLEVTVRQLLLVGADHHRERHAEVAGELLRRGRKVVGPLQASAQVLGARRALERHPAAEPAAETIDGELGGHGGARVLSQGSPPWRARARGRDRTESSGREAASRRRAAAWPRRPRRARGRGRPPGRAGRRPCGRRGG